MFNTILPPFTAVPLPQYMREELRRRRDTYGLNFVKSQNYSEDFDFGDPMAKYRGPMTAWIRMVSNAKTDDREGFILYGGQGMKHAYGMGNKIPTKSIEKTNSTIIGYDRFGVEHTIDNLSSGTIQKFRPAPGIESVEVDIRKDIYRAAFIKWKCYSVDQLNYMSQYMFTPYTTVILEWGWNTFNKSSLIDIADIGRPSRFKAGSKSELQDPGQGILGAYTNPLLIETGLEVSDGRYDGMIGHIINFDYTFNASEMCFNCTTEIASNSKFYLGLAFSGIVSKNEENETSGKVNIKDIFNDHLLNNLKKYINDGYASKSAGWAGVRIARNVKEDLIVRQSQYKEGKEALSYKKTGTSQRNVTSKNLTSVKIDGRIFLPSKYNERVCNGNPMKHADELYITFGLLTEILNDLINTSEGEDAQFSMDISSTKIGAHPNLISCSENFLIPNSIAPYFGPESLIDDPSKLPYIPRETQSETPLNDVDKNVKVKLSEADKLMDSVFNGGGRRQDLNSIINYFRISKGAVPGEICFPLLTDLPNGSYYGNLKDIYLNYESIRKLLNESKDLKGFYKAICEMLNKDCPIWRLEPVAGATQNSYSIQDDKFLDVKQITLLKERMGISTNEPAIYHFDAFSQDSFLKDFSMGVKLSDAIANMVLYQANNDLSKNTPDDPGRQSVSAQKYLFNKISDYVLDRLKVSKLGANTTAPANESATTREDQRKFVDNFVKTVDENLLMFTRVEPGSGKRHVSRLRLPNNQLAKLTQMLNDDNPLFTNINSMPIPGVNVEFSILGIAGFRTFQVFGINGLPIPYSTGVLFQITSLKHSIGSEGWVTHITAAVRPVKSLISLLGQ